MTGTELWRRLTLAQQRVAMLCAIVLLLAVVDMAALRPLRQVLRDARQEIAAAEQIVVASLQALAREPQVEAAYQLYEPYLKTGRATAELDTSQLLKDVEFGVREAGLTVNDLKPRATAEDNPAIAVALEGEGHLDAVVRFLVYVQRSTALLRVTKLTLRAGTQDDPNLEFSMVVSQMPLPAATN